MSLKLNQEIWIYVERIYIHCYGTESFVVFLKQYGIEYDDPQYDLLKTKGPPREDPFYIFMSEPSYQFANFMQTVPTYKYLPILQKIVFDETIIATRKDGWNYYGEPIRGWHPKIVELLRTTGVNIDTVNKKLFLSDEEEDFYGPDFLPYDFNDLFLDYIRKEINESYKNGQLLAVIMLSRKLLEALTVRIFETVLPKMVNGGYNQTNHELWFNKNKGRYHVFEILVTNLKSKSSDFHEDKDLIEDICKMTDLIRSEANKFVHRDYQIPDEPYLKTLKIESAIVATRKVFKKYCNP